MDRDVADGVAGGGGGGVAVEEVPARVVGARVHPKKGRTVEMVRGLELVLGMIAEARKMGAGGGDLTGALAEFLDVRVGTVNHKLAPSHAVSFTAGELVALLVSAKSPIPMELRRAFVGALEREIKDFARAQEREERRVAQGRGEEASDGG